MTQTRSDLDATALLRAAGMRVTRPRLAVLDALHACPHSTADTIAATVRLTLGTVSTQAVYDVLHAVTAAGLARRIEPAGSAAIFEVRVGDNHHHLVCRSCASVADVDCVVGAAPCLTPADDLGFVIDEAEVVFWGLCSKCSADPTRTATGPTDSTSTDPTPTDPTPTDTATAKTALEAPV
jgi:Fe2+ or Zn2+ uptake regulation protein